MIAETKPDVVIVTTVDGFHHDYIVRAMELGCDVITEKPMTIDDEKCRQILDATKRTGRKCRVTFNYRYSPPRTQVKDLLMSGVDRRRPLRRLPLDAQHPARRRLLPPLAPPEENSRRPDGAQGHPPLRPGQLVAARPSRSSVTATGKREFYTPADGQAPRPAGPPRALPDLSREGRLRLRAGPGRRTPGSRSCTSTARSTTATSATAASSGRRSTSRTP